MTAKVLNKFVRSGIPKGAGIITERGKVSIENLRITDRVLTEEKTFIPIKRIRKSSTKEKFFLAAHGLDPIPLTRDSQVCVRDVELKTEHGQVVPVISWPYWASLQNLNPSKHMVLSPFNPHTINPHHSIMSRNTSSASAYIDQEKQIWLQIEKIEFSDEDIDVFYIELEKDNGVAVEYLSIK